MFIFNSKLLSSFIITAIFIFSSILNSQAQEKKLITPQDHGKWEMLRNYSISKDGKWSTYQVDNVNKDKTTQLYNIETKSTISYPNVASGRFSETGTWFVYEKVLSGKKEKARAKKEKKDNAKSNDRVLVNLEDSDTLVLENVKEYGFSQDDSYLAMLRENDGVKTLVIKDLATESLMSFGNIKSFSWQENGEMMAMIMETKDSIGNGIQLYDPKHGSIKVLDQSKEIYSKLQWGEDSDYLFAIQSIRQKRSEEDSYQLLHWSDISTGNPTFHSFNHTEVDGFPTDTRILPDHIRIADNGNSVFFETFSWIQSEEKKDVDSESEENSEKEVDDYEAPDLEIWHSKDELIIPQQKKNRLKDSELANVHVWEINENRHVTLTSEVVESIRIQANNEVLLGRDQSPYAFEAMFGRPSNDIYTINCRTGIKKKVLSAIGRTSSVSPNNRFFVYVKDDNLHLYDIEKQTSSNITEDLAGRFIQGESYDYPVKQKPPFNGGFSEWSEDGSSYLFNSEYDVWRGFVDGEPAHRVTKGKEDEIIYRHHFVNREVDHMDMSQPQFFSMRGEKTKMSGYSKGIIGSELEKLIYDNSSVYSLNMPHEGIDILTFRSESFDRSRNFSMTDLNFSKIEKISNTNTFQNDYAWGQAELISFKNAKENDAQAILYYPANYEKGKKYPMITYIYETLSDGLHRYTTPSKTSYYNTTVWQQNGYFVLKPDIEFIAGDPGVSSAKTLENAVAAVVDKGDVDPAKVGLVGHSWGGYQAGFVPTQTDIFAASVAGAGLTNFISMYLAVTPAFGGSPENGHFEVSQERMISPPWVSPENYIRNSSVMNVESLNTPILFEVGDNDMNVNWRQGIEYYNAARRAGKQFVLLVYAKEGHGVREEKNASDYQQKILKWFGHYLKGEEAEDWITTGVPYSEQQRRLKKGEK